MCADSMREPSESERESVEQPVSLSSFAQLSAPLQERRARPEINDQGLRRAKESET